MWEYFAGAFLLLVGVLLGAGLRGREEGGFTTLVKNLEKMNRTRERIEQHTNQYAPCRECDYVGIHETQLGADKDLEHHLLTKHPTAAHQCPFCPVIVQSDLNSFVTQDKMRVHILQMHPEHQEEAVVWRPVNTSAVPSLLTPSA